MPVRGLEVWMELWREDCRRLVRLMGLVLSVTELLDFPFPSYVSFRGEEGWYRTHGAYDFLAFSLSKGGELVQSLGRRCLSLAMDNHSPLADEVDPGPPDSLLGLL